MKLVRPSLPRDVTYLSAHLREDDLRELLAAGSPGPRQALQDGLDYSRECFSVVDAEDNAQVMFGVVPGETPEIGYVWLLGSAAINQEPIKFLRHCKRWVDKLQSDFPVLTNSVDKRNKLHIQWLRWLGFTFLREVRGNGPGGLPFIEFARIQHV